MNATLASFLLSLVGPLAKRVLTSLGIGVVSYAAVSTALNAAISAAKGAWGGLSGDVLNIIQLSGINTALSIICGALVARVALQAVGKLQKIA